MVSERDRPANLEEGVPERLDRLGCRLFQINERFLDRLSGWEDLGFVENYVRGQFSIIIKFAGRGEPKGHFWAVGLDSAVGQINDGTVLRGRDELAKPSYRHGRQEQSVFVDIVELASGPQQGVRVPVFVRLEHVQDQVIGGWESFDYLRLPDRVFEVLPRFMAWKVDARRAVRDRLSGEAGPKVVERTTYVMYGVPGRGGQLMGQSAALGTNAYAVVAGLRVLIRERDVVARIDNPLDDGFDALDVLVGPLNFPGGHLEGVFQL